jgi:hypothetical protein
MAIKTSVNSENTPPGMFDKKRIGGQIALY